MKGLRCKEKSCSFHFLSCLVIVGGKSFSLRYVQHVTKTHKVRRIKKRERFFKLKNMSIVPDRASGKGSVEGHLE